MHILCQNWCNELQYIFLFFSSLHVNLLFFTFLNIYFHFQFCLNTLYTFNFIFFKDELLVTTCEEQIRTLVRSVYHTSVYELRSASTESLLRLMNQIFQKFGVEFLSTTVKSISIPETIAKTYEADTKHGTAITHEIKLYSLFYSFISFPTSRPQF